MFRFADLGTVIWPVTIGEGTFRVAFRVFTRQELAARRRSGAAAALAHLKDNGPPATVEELAAVYEAIDARTAENVEELQQRVTDWFDVQDPQGQPLSCTRERVQALIDTEYGYSALLEGLLQASREGPAKNSLPGPAGQPARDQA